MVWSVIFDLRQRGLLEDTLDVSCAEAIAGIHRLDDLSATILRLVGLDHERLSVRITPRPNSTCLR